MYLNCYVKKQKCRIVRLSGSRKRRPVAWTFVSGLVPEKRYGAQVAVSRYPYGLQYNAGALLRAFRTLLQGRSFYEGTVFVFIMNLNHGLLPVELSLSGAGLEPAQPPFYRVSGEPERGIEPHWKPEKIFGIQQTAPLGIADTHGPFQRVLPCSNMFKNVVSV